MSYNAKVQVSSTEGAMVYAGTLPIPTADNNGRDGWLFKKTSGVEKFNYYFWSQGSHALTLGDNRTHFIVSAVDTYSDVTSVPFIVIYTKPTGVGDAGAFYHSRIAYTVDAFARINLGEICQFYTHNAKPSTIQGYRQIPLRIEIKDGDAKHNEEILYMTVHSDSTAPDTCSILVSNCGFETNHTEAQFLNLELNGN